MIVDGIGRRFKKLRLSVTEECNFSCLYCVPEGGVHRNRKGLPLPELLERVASLHEFNDFSEVRITGGEPLLYRELLPLVRGLRSLNIPRVSLTTNGSLLERKVEELKESGLTSVNVSLDSLRPDLFRFLSRGGELSKVLSGIEASLKLRMPLKLNATILRGINDDDVVPLLEYARERGIRLRYIELMAMGHMYDSMDRYLFSLDDILRKIGEVHLIRTVLRRDNMPARYWELEDGYRFGIIANTSDPFCEKCDRLRMSSRGDIYGCLSVNEGFSYDAQDGEEKKENLLRKALEQKQSRRFSGSTLSMKSIGG